MELRKSAESHFTTEFEYLDSNNEWQYAFCGRFSPVDRFLSNFHRPLQRRMLHTPVEDSLPDSRVIRNIATGEVYIVGQTRHDDENGDIYTRISVAHFVSNSSAGMATLNRKVPDEARPDSTVGELVDVEVGQFYMAVEYKTSIENFGTDEVFEDRYLIFAPIVADLQADDVVLLNGRSYVVNSPFIDSEYSSAVATREPEDRFTGTYRVLTSTYSPTTGVVTPSYIDYAVTCVVNEFKGVLDMKEKHGIDSDVEIYLKSPTFPVEPKIGNRFLAKGEQFIIRGVSQDQEAAYQWRLRCERTNS